MFFCTIFPVVVAAVAMVMDLRTAKVDNGWILFSLVLGLFVKFRQGGMAGLSGAVAGSLIPLILLGVLFFFHMMGAGDIKLFCALGSVMGACAILKCILVSLFLGASISIAILISTGIVSQRFHFFIRYINETVRTGQIKPYSTRDITSPENFHFTVPVFLSAVLYAGGVY